MPLTATGMRVVMRQLAEIDTDPIDGIRIDPSDDLSELRFDLDGPEGTPFDSGCFRVVLVFDEHYPEVPPKGYFRTEIFHPNVSDRGDICVNTLKRDWSPQLGLRHVLVVIRCLLVEPNPESALNEEAGRLLLEDFADFERKARMYTNVHALRPAGVPRISHADGVAAAPGVTKAEGERGAAPEFGAAPSMLGGSRGAAVVSTPEANVSSNMGRPLRSLESNAAQGSAAPAKPDAAESSLAVDKAKKKAAEKKKNALKRI